MNHEGARWEMQTFRASDGLAIAYALDDYTDPWKPADTLILTCRHGQLEAVLRMGATSRS